MSDIERGKPIVNVGALFQHAKEQQSKGDGPLERGFSFKSDDMNTYVPPAEVVASRNPDLIGVELTPIVPVHEIGSSEDDPVEASTVEEEFLPVLERHPELKEFPLDLDRVEAYMQSTFAALNDPGLIAMRDRMLYEMTSGVIEGESHDVDDPAQIESKQPMAMILVGLPGSGKSTLSRQLREMHSEDRTLVYVSSDQYIEQWAEEEGKTYGEVFSKYADKANNACLKSFHDAIRDRNDVLIDRTNMDRGSRRKWLGKLKDAGYMLVAFDVHCDPEELARRNEARKEQGRAIPDHVMESFRKRYEAPSKDEGFDHVIKE